MKINIVFLLMCLTVFGCTIKLEIHPRIPKEYRSFERVIDNIQDYALKNNDCHSAKDSIVALFYKFDTKRLDYKIEKLKNSLLKYKYGPERFTTRTNNVCLHLLDYIDALEVSKQLKNKNDAYKISFLFNLTSKNARNGKFSNGERILLTFLSLNNRQLFYDRYPNLSEDKKKGMIRMLINEASNNDVLEILDELSLRKYRSSPKVLEYIDMLKGYRIDETKSKGYK